MEIIAKYIPIFALLFLLGVFIRHGSTPVAIASLLIGLFIIGLVLAARVDVPDIPDIDEDTE